MVVEKRGFCPWKRESSTAEGVGEREREGPVVGEREKKKKKKEPKLWEKDEKGLGMRWGEEKSLG